MPDTSVRIEISTASVIKVILVILLFVLLYLLRNIVMILAFAFIVAAAVNPFATWLEKKRIPRILGVLLLFFIVLGAVVFVLSLIIPYITRDISQLTQTIPNFLERVSASLEDVQRGSPNYLDFVSELQNLLDSFGNYLQQFSQSAVALLINIFGGVFSFIAIIVVSFYLSVMKRGIEGFIEFILPEKYEVYVLDLLKRVETKVGKWLQGQLLLALIIGLVVYIGLSILGIKFALVWGLLAMVLELIPIVGPVLAAIPPVILGFFQAPILGLWIILFFIVVQQLENNLLVPLVLGKATGLNPLAVIIALLVGGQLAGIIGVLIAVPVATVLVEVLDDIVARQRNNRKHAAA